MRDKLRNIKPFHFGPAQTPQDDYKFATEDPVDPPATISNINKKHNTEQ